MALTYKDSGVDIEAGNKLVERIKPLAKATSRPEVMGGIGGFGAIFDIAKSNYKDPLLVSSTDGVGTKLKIAIDSGIHKTIGIDLVAMCVNDILVQGAEPLFFLDYFATGKLDNNVAVEVIASIAEGCSQAGCALVGGETAEMPAMYKDGEYDLAGFAVGAVERKMLLPTSDISVGDVVFGIASSGLHSNGYSLVRKVLQKEAVSLNAKAPFADGKTYAEALLEPTRIYVKLLLPLVKKGAIKALSHITGGGLLENIPRILPESTVAALSKSSWRIPELFEWLQKSGGIEDREMLRTFNCGVGMVLVVGKDKAFEVETVLKNAGERYFTLGEIASRKTEEEQVVIS